MYAVEEGNVILMNDVFSLSKEMQKTEYFGKRVCHEDQMKKKDYHQSFIFLHCCDFKKLFSALLQEERPACKKN